MFRRIRRVMSCNVKHQVCKKIINVDQLTMPYMCFHDSNKLPIIMSVNICLVSVCLLDFPEPAPGCTF